MKIVIKQTIYSEKFVMQRLSVHCFTSWFELYNSTLFNALIQLGLLFYDVIAERHHNYSYMLKRH